MIQNQHIGPFNSPWWLGPLNLLTQALLHEMMWRPHMRPDDHVVTWWHAMTVSAQWVITRGAMNKQTNVKSSNHVTENSRGCWEPGVRTNSSLHRFYIDFRNTFQIVSSQRQKRKAKKNSVQTPPRLILMSVTLSQCQPPPTWADISTEVDPGDSAVGGCNVLKSGGTRSRNLSQNSDRVYVSSGSGRNVSSMFIFWTA